MSIANERIVWFYHFKLNLPLSFLPGVDDVFVFISTFRQSAHLTYSMQRMIYTVKTAGRATFLTSFTTAAAYAANTFSQVHSAEQNKHVQKINSPNRDVLTF